MNQDNTNTLERLIQQRFNRPATVPNNLTERQINELHKLLDHRSQRAFQAEPIAPDLLNLLFACALSAPSKSDLQQADIIHIKSPATRQAVHALIPSMPWVADAPVFLVFCGNNRRLRQLCEAHQLPFANHHLDSFMNTAVDAGIVLMNFIRAAEAVDLACCPVSVIRNRAAEVSEILQLPQGVFPLAGLCVGYPQYRTQISPRLPLSVTVHTDVYDETDQARAIEAYDRYRHHVQPLTKSQQRYVDRYGQAEFYGWSEDKARQYSVPERADFGAYIRSQDFDLS